MKKELTEILKNNNLQNLMSDISELTLYAFLKDGLIKDIPILV